MSLNATASRSRRHALLALIVALHLAVLAGWRFTTPRAPAVPQREAELVFLTVPPPVPVPRTKALDRPPPVERTPRTAAPVQPRAPRMADAEPAPAAPPAQATEPVPPDPFAQPAPVVESVLERSRHAAKGVDSQLRKESPNLFAVYVQPDTKLGVEIAKAYKGSGGFSIAETLLPSGDTLGRVTTPFGSYCLLKRGNRGGGGLNAIDEAGKTLIINCPK